MKKILAVSLAALSLSACVVTPSIGSKAADTPPKLVPTSDGKSVTWNDPGLFGPVPAELTAKAASICGSLDTKETKYQAIGYHPQAQGQDGKPFAGGGYFCVAK